MASWTTETRRRARGALRAATFTASFAVAIGAALPASAQPAPAAPTPAQPTPAPEVRCAPVAERAGRDLGCWITAVEALGDLPHAAPLHWHIDAYPSRAAAEAAKGPRGTVVESLGRVWLFTVAEAGWRPAQGGGGERVAAVGPLPTREGARYTAQYMEGVFAPGMRSSVHRHSGPEAWYTLAGRMCLETPGERMVVGPGESGIVPEGPPMMLTGIGTEQRRSLVLILHDASRPPSTLAHDWTPQGLCRE